MDTLLSEGENEYHWRQFQWDSLHDNVQWVPDRIDQTKGKIYRTDVLSNNSFTFRPNMSVPKGLSGKINVDVLHCGDIHALLKYKDEQGQIAYVVRSLCYRYVLDNLQESMILYQRLEGGVTT